MVLSCGAPCVFRCARLSLALTRRSAISTCSFSANSCGVSFGWLVSLRMKGVLLVATRLRTAGFRLLLWLFDEEVCEIPLAGAMWGAVSIGFCSACEFRLASSGGAVAGRWKWNQRFRRT